MGEETPVPIKGIICGESEALVLIVTVPVRVPATVGVNTTL